MEFDEESEPEIPLYNRAELIERYQVLISWLSSEVLHKLKKSHFLPVYQLYPWLLFLNLTIKKTWLYFDDF